MFELCKRCIWMPRFLVEVCGWWWGALRDMLYMSRGLWNRRQAQVVVGYFSFFNDLWMIIVNLYLILYKKTSSHNNAMDIVDLGWLKSLKHDYWCDVWLSILIWGCCRATTPTTSSASIRGFSRTRGCVHSAGTSSPALQKPSYMSIKLTVI